MEPVKRLGAVLNAASNQLYYSVNEMSKQRNEIKGTYSLTDDRFSISEALPLSTHVSHTELLSVGDQ